jgi:rubrerythrin
MSKLNGTETRENLLKAFIGESQARNKYAYFAGVARKENYQAIAAVFEETADHEKEHAERLFKFLEDGDMVEFTVNVPAGKVGSTVENLTQAVNGEHKEQAEMYPLFAKIARKEGFVEIAVVMENIAKAELYHEKRFEKLLHDIKTQELLKKNDLVIWKCTNCGFHITSKNAPKICPACGHSEGYFIEVSDLLF